MIKNPELKLVGFGPSTNYVDKGLLTIRNGVTGENSNPTSGKIIANYTVIDLLPVW
jgi:hypothetical protein